jgi:predicted secreted hydrolase
LQSADNQEWGYQLTFFRRRLSSSLPARTSRWGATDIYFAHFAVTDVTGQRIRFADRNARGSELGLAGASAEPYRVFVRDWSAEGSGDVVKLQAEDGGARLNVDLRAVKPPMLQGKEANGLSSKGAGEGNASYYYSLPRMATDGTIVLNGVEHAVSGTSWMDHEWGTWGFAEGQTGWDWFGLQLDDDRELMWGQLRRADGSLDLAYGAISQPDGSVTPLDQSQVVVTATTTWTSPHTGARYPAGWRIQIPGENVDISVTPRLADQELRVGAFVYWEGSVAVEGTVGGTGYVELTGYGARGQLLR